MKITVNGIITKSFDKLDDRVLYNKLVKEALLRQGNLSEPEVLQQFALFIGKYITKTFKQAIEKQALYGEKFAQMYPPLNTAYNQKKGNTTGTKNMFYKNSSWLYNNFKYWLKDGNVYVGFRVSDRHPKGASAVELLKWLDTGTINMQARPLVSLIVEEVFNDIERFVNMYIAFLDERIKEQHGQLEGSQIIKLLETL